MWPSFCKSSQMMSVGRCCATAAAAEPLARAEGLDRHAVAEHDHVAAPDQALAHGLGEVFGQQLVAQQFTLDVLQMGAGLVLALTDGLHGGNMTPANHETTRGNHGYRLFVQAGFQQATGARGRRHPAPDRHGASMVAAAPRTYAGHLVAVAGLGRIGFSWSQPGSEDGRPRKVPCPCPRGQDTEGQYPHAGTARPIFKARDEQGVSSAGRLGGGGRKGADPGPRNADRRHQHQRHGHGIPSHHGVGARARGVKEEVAVGDGIMGTTTATGYGGRQAHEQALPLLVVVGRQGEQVEAEGRGEEDRQLHLQEDLRGYRGKTAREGTTSEVSAVRHGRTMAFVASRQHPHEPLRTRRHDPADGRTSPCRRYPTTSPA